MKKATHIILYDNAQYTRRDWRNRNKIITPNGPSWLSIPIDVKGKYYQKINEAKVKDKNWPNQHWSKIYQNYKNAPHFKQYSSYFEGLYLETLPNFEFLSDINRLLLEKCIQLLDIDIEILDSRQFEIRGGKTGKLINICKDLNANEYFTGPAAKGYMTESLFPENNIKLTYYDLDNFPIYNQQWNNFDHNVSILDMFFNLGDNTKQYFNWRNTDEK